MSDDRNETERECDLMAYADGLLEDDPARKALVEEGLRDTPQDAVGVEACRALNRALRCRYGRWIDDPVPERLYAALDRPARPAVRTVLRIAAVLMLAALIGVSGWWVGRSERSDRPSDALRETGKAGLAAPVNAVAVGAAAVRAAAARDGVPNGNGVTGAN